LKSIFLGVLVVTAAAATVGSLAAQTVFRSNVQYVTVDVVVTDKNDKPITDLSQDDFEIEDNGKPQKVSDFKYVSIPIASRSLDLATVSEPQPDITSNLPATPDSRLFAIVIDDLHLLEKDLVNIKRILTEFLASLSADDEVALVFVSHSDLGVNFTRNTGKLVSTISNLRASLGFGLDALGSDPSGNAGAYTMNYARSSVITLRNVAKSLAGSRHPRRAILWVSNGETIDMFGLDGPPEMMMFAEYQDTFRDAARADVPIYTVSTRGSLPEDSIRGDQIVSPSMRSRVLKAMRVQRNNLIVIANTTGGRAIVDASDMPRMIHEIVQENGSYYLLGYYPDPFVADGKFHELKVKVKREGAHVRARTGYDAPRAERASGPVLTAIDSAMSAGVNVSALPLRAFAQPIASDGKKLTVAVSVELTYPAPVDGSSRFDDNLQLKIVALDPDAKIKASAGRALHFTAPAPKSGDVTFLINDVIQVPAQFLTLRVAVGSESLGKAGSVQVAIDMPKASKGLTLGGIAVGVDGAPREAVMQPAAFDGLIPFQPTVSRAFSASDVLRLFAHVYWKDKAKPSATMTLTGPNGAVTSTPSLSAMKPSGDQQDAVIAAMLPVRGMAPGKYHLAISASLPGGKPVTRDVLFEVK
jgi:VWFA-related protein